MLSADRTARLAEFPLSYPESGATAATLPRGYVHLVRHVTHDADAFASMAERLMTWQVHEDAGLGVVASAGRVQADAVVELRIGPPAGARTLPRRLRRRRAGPRRIRLRHARRSS